MSQFDPGRGHGQKPCRMAQDTTPWDRLIYILRNNRTAEEAAVRLAHNTVTVPTFTLGVGPDDIPPFMRLDWNNGWDKQACLSDATPCGPWPGPDTYCNCGYPPSGHPITTFLQQNVWPDTAPSASDRSVCIKRGHKVVQVQIPVPPLTSCINNTTSLGCSGGEVAYAIKNRYVVINYGDNLWHDSNGATGQYTNFDAIKGWLNEQHADAVAGCADLTTHQDQGWEAGQSVEAYADGGYDPCTDKWTSTSLLGPPDPGDWEYGFGAGYQAMLDGHFWQTYNAGTSTWSNLPGTDTSLLAASGIVTWGNPGYASGGDPFFRLWFSAPSGTWPNLTGSYVFNEYVYVGTGGAHPAPGGVQQNQTAWSCRETFFVITNGGANTEFLSAVGNGKLHLSGWGMDSTHLAASGQTARDDARYPWRRDGRRTLAPVLFDFYTCDGTPVATVGEPLTASGGEPYWTSNRGGFDWTHRTYHWGARHVCGADQEIWFQYGYGAEVADGGNCAGVPLTAVTYTDEMAATTFYPGSVAMFGVWAVQATWPGAAPPGVSGTGYNTDAVVGGGAVVQMSVETAEVVPGHDWMRPHGDDRLLMDETHVFAVASSDNTLAHRLITYDAPASGNMTLTFTADPSYLDGKPVVAYGTGRDGIWTAAAASGNRLVLSARLANSDARIGAAGLVRGPKTDNGNPDFGFGVVGLQRWPHAWPLNGRATVAGAAASAGTTWLTVDDSGTLCPGDGVVFSGVPGLGASGSVLGVSGNVFTVAGSASGASGYVLNAPYYDGTWHQPPHWSWCSTRPTGRYWVVGWTGVRHDQTDTVASDWDGPDCWVQPPQIDGSSYTVQERCKPAPNPCGPGVLWADIPDMIPWTCGSVAVNLIYQCVKDPFYQTPAQFPLYNGDGTAYGGPVTFPTARYVEPVADSAAAVSAGGLYNPDTASSANLRGEVVSLPTPPGSAYPLAFTPEVPPRGAHIEGALGDCPVWLRSWDLFANGVQVL